MGYLTDKQRKQILARYDAGDDMTQIAVDFGVVRKTIYNIAKSNGRKGRSRLLTDIERQRITRLRERGVSIRNIANALGRDYKCIQRFLGGGTVRRPAMPHEMRKRYVDSYNRMRAEGKSVIDIERQLGVTYSSLSNWAKTIGENLVSDHELMEPWEVDELFFYRDETLPADLGPEARSLSRHKR